MEPENDSSYYTPKYFKEVTHPITGDQVYEYCSVNAYNSNYWEDREKCAFQHLPRVRSRVQLRDQILCAGVCHAANSAALDALRRCGGGDRGSDGVKTRRRGGRRRG